MLPVNFYHACPPDQENRSRFFITGGHVLLAYAPKGRKSALGVSIIGRLGRPRVRIAVPIPVESPGSINTGRLAGRFTEDRGWITAASVRNVYSIRRPPLTALGVQGRLGTPNLGAISFFLLPLIGCYGCKNRRFLLHEFPWRGYGASSPVACILCPRFSPPPDFRAN